MKTLAEHYCTARGFDPDAFAAVALRPCLHLPARLLYRPIGLVFPQFFTADFDLVHNIGHLTHEHELTLDLEEHRYHPYNQSRLRRALRLCISTTRVRRLVRTTLRAAPPADIPAIRL